MRFLRRRPRVGVVVMATTGGVPEGFTPPSMALLSPSLTTLKPPGCVPFRPTSNPDLLIRADSLCSPFHAAEATLSSLRAADIQTCSDQAERMRLALERKARLDAVIALCDSDSGAWVGSRRMLNVEQVRAAATGGTGVSDV